jgi:hypothetical protein
MAAEMESIETFVEFLCDDDRSTCTLQERNLLAHNLGMTPHEVEEELSGWGIKVVGRPTLTHQLAA